MVNDQTGDRRGGLSRSRSRIERRLVVLDIASVLVLTIPGLRSAAEQLLVGIVTLAVLLGLLAVLVLVVAWRVARRHPVADLLAGAWLLRRHERRQHQSVDARSWYGAPRPYDARSWETDKRTRSW